MAISYFRHLFYPSITQVFIFPPVKECPILKELLQQHPWRHCSILWLCGSSALNCNPQSFFFFFPAFQKIQSYLLLFKFVYLRSKKTLFCFLSDGPHRFKMWLCLWRGIFAPSCSIKHKLYLCFKLFYL